MSHIVIAGYPGVGHAIPTLDAVTELVSRGHRVTCVTPKASAALLTATGANVVTIDSALAGVDLAVLDTVEEMDRLMIHGVEEDKRLIAAVESHCADDRPDLIISDATKFAVGRILGRKWGVPIAAFCTVLLSNEHFSFYDRVAVKRGPMPKRRRYATKAFADVLALLKAHGQSDTSLEEYYRPQEGLYVAFYPRSFQFAGDTFDYKNVFVGPNLTHGTDPGDWVPPTDGRKVLMISLGTSVHRKPDFFRTCVDAFRDSDWHLVLHAHTGLDLDELGELPPNVEVHRWLPQLAVMRHTDVLLCHGGMGTLMAAFAEATPVVVVPNSGEQMVNAERVLELGLGQVFAQSDATAEALRAAVEQVHADPGVRDRVQAMRADIHRAGGGAHAADAIEEYIKRSADEQGSEGM